MDSTTLLSYQKTRALRVFFCLHRDESAGATLEWGLDEFAVAATRRFLQSAVFVDDKIYERHTGMPVAAAVDLPKPRKLAFQPELTSSADPVPGPAEAIAEEQPYHPKNLVSSFAKAGIICALYEPEEGFSTASDSEIFKLCESPDIIILDWDFSGDQGVKALNLIAALVSQSYKEFPHHIRLLAIYTADQSLVAVANKIADRLKADGFKAEPEKSQLRIQSGATRLVVFGKQIERFGQDERQFTVKDADLADRLIAEFGDMNKGLLPAYALHGLAAIRRNSKRILDRFHCGMDSAFLLQRSLIRKSEEGFDQLPELLADELRAVVQDGHTALIEPEKIALAALAAETVSPAERTLIEAFDQGKDQPKRTTKLKNELVKDGTIPLCHQELAALFGSRTQYAPEFRLLGYGTIIRRYAPDGLSSTYAYCLVPECDSLRLDPAKKIRFPFWTLDEDAFKNGSSERNGMVFPIAGGACITLTAGGKATEKLWTEEFAVDGQKKMVIAQNQNGSFVFPGPPTKIEWVGQLKPLHAHRIAHEIAQGLSRVGLAEAEWLRLFCQS